MTKLSFFLATAAMSAGIRHAVAAPAPALSFVFPELQLSPPQVHSSPVSVKMPVPAPTTLSERRIDIGFFCGGVFEYQEPSPIGLIELFGSVDDFRSALASDSVTVVELKPSADFFTPSAEHLDRAITLPATDAALFRAILTFDSSFDWRDIPRPESRADFRIKFKHASRVVTLDLFLAERSIRLIKADYAGPVVSFEFGYVAAAEILERHFPGATARKG